jgi:hypothetical protein
MLNTPSHINMLCMSMNFQVRIAHPFCVDAVAICKLTSLEDSLEKALCSVNGVWMQLINSKYFEDYCLGQSHFSCDVTWASPQLFFHSCMFGVFIIGWCPYILWVTWIHKCNSCRTLPVVRRYCCYRSNIGTSRWCHPRKYTAYCCAPVPAKLLLVPSVKGTSQYS